MTTVSSSSSSSSASSINYRSQEYIWNYARRVLEKVPKYATLQHSDFTLKVDELVQYIIKVLNNPEFQQNSGSFLSHNCFQASHVCLNENSPQQFPAYYAYQYLCVAAQSPSEAQQDKMGLLCSHPANGSTLVIAAQAAGKSLAQMYTSMR